MIVFLVCNVNDIIHNKGSYHDIEREQIYSSEEE